MHKYKFWTILIRIINFLAHRSFRREILSKMKREMLQKSAVFFKSKISENQIIEEFRDTVLSFCVYGEPRVLHVLPRNGFIARRNNFQWNCTLSFIII